MTTNIDDTTLLPAHVEQLTKAAEDLGRDHGANAAEWYAQDASVAFLKFLAEHGIHAVLHRQSMDGNIYNQDLIKKEAA